MVLEISRHEEDEVKPMGYVEELRAKVGHIPLIFVGSVVIIVDDEERVLLQQRRFPNGSWGLPGGLMELGESTTDVAKREVFEETRLIVEDLQLIDVYSGPGHYIKANNGDEFYVVTVAYYTKKFTGVLEVNKAESIQVKFCHLDHLPARMVGSHQVIINDFKLLGV